MTESLSKDTSTRVAANEMVQISAKSICRLMKAPTKAAVAIVKRLANQINLLDTQKPHANCAAVMAIKNMDTKPPHTQPYKTLLIMGMEASASS